MEALKAEIERKKRQMGATQLLGPEKKYFKRGDLSAQQAEEYRAKHMPSGEDVKQLEELKKIKSSSRARGNEEAADCDVPLLPRVDVVRRLRERGEPILLFGENEEEAFRRLQTAEVEEPDKIDGIRNDFRDALAKVDEVYLQEVLKSKGDDGEPKKNKFETLLYESQHTYEDLLDMVNDINKGDIEHDHKIISEFIKVMIRMWSDELNSREEGVKMTVKGKLDAGIFAQTKTYLKPLLKMLRKNTLTDDIRDSMLKMVRNALQRDYIMCNEAYMEMAIGNAPWPIGVTNAGIHARPARENIFSKHVAHVLNDETQRKYIQGLKRLLTKAQQHYPTEPSRSIDYVRTTSNGTDGDLANE